MVSLATHIQWACVASRVAAPAGSGSRPCSSRQRNASSIDGSSSSTSGGTLPSCGKVGSPACAIAGILGPVARVTFLGTSDAFHSAGRRNAAYLVEDGASRVAVDFGPTALQSLAILGIDPASIDAVLLTHLHGDHIVGVPFLVLDGIHHSRRSRPLEIVGPVGTRARIEALFRATYDDALSGPLPFELRLHEIEPGESRRVASLTVTCFEADHMDPPHRPLMLRIE